MTRDEAARCLHAGAIELIARSPLSVSSIKHAVDLSQEALNISLQAAESLIPPETQNTPASPKVVGNVPVGGLVDQAQKATLTAFGLGVNITLNRREAAWLKEYLRNSMIEGETELDAAVRGNIFNKLVHAGAQ